MSLDYQIIYKQLLQRHKHIRVPMIQRDYAQGRPAESEVRGAQRVDPRLLLYRLDPLQGQLVEAEGDVEPAAQALGAGQGEVSAGLTLTVGQGVEER